MAMQRVGNYYGTVTETLSQDGHTIDVQIGPWQQIAAMRNVLCEDGKERTISTREADTFFTVPGRTSAYGKTVTGFVSYDSDKERFTFKATGKYRDMLTNHTRKDTPMKTEITVTRMYDDNPDLSWLEDASRYSGCTLEEARRYHAEDAKRLATYGTDWYAIGIRAECEIVVNNVIQTITSGGLWGIESDADEAYLTEVETEQTAELRGILAELGIEVSPIA